VTDERKPQPGDRVRVTFEADFVSGDDSRHAVVDIADGMGPIRIGIPAWSTFEVLKRADNPSEDPIGTLRREDHADGHSIWLSTQDRLGRRGWFCVHSTVVGNLGGRVEHDEVAGLPVIGSIPGTPAAPPRTFPSDGPEPPSSVRAVTDGAHGIPFLVRYGDHWRWARDLDDAEDFAYTGGSWRDVTGEMQTPVTFTEVV